MKLVLIVLLPLFGALLPPIMIRAGRNLAALSAFVASGLSFTLLLSYLPEVLAGKPVHLNAPWMPTLGLNLNFFLDGLGFLFAGMILSIGLLIIIYARFYLSKKDPMGSFYSFLLLFQGAMLGIVLSDNILLLLIFWELTSLSSFLLIGFWKHLPEGRQGARMALTITGGGGLSLIAGMLLLGQIAGSYDLSSILANPELIKTSSLYLPALILILLGCFTKSAQFPFHFWLPHAMAAPTPVSAYLHSATMVKAGIFLMARLWPALSGSPEWFYIVATTGLITMVLGAFIALYKDDLKGLLAYSTVSHLGLITMLLGFATPLAAIAAVFHIINHATFKAALFMNAGIIDHEVGTRDVKKLGGLFNLMPITATLGVLAAASMAGFPLLNGFISKEMMLDEVFKMSWAGQSWVLPLIATVGALFSVAYSFRYIVHVFFGEQKPSYPSKPHDPPFGLWLPPAILVALVVLIGLFPEHFAGGLVRVASSALIGGSLPSFHLAIWHGFTPALLSSLVALGFGLVLLWKYVFTRKLWDQSPRPEAKSIFDYLLENFVGFSRWITFKIHSGSLEFYLSLIFVAAIAAGAVTFFTSSYAPGDRALLQIAPVTLLGWVLLVAASGLMVFFHHYRFLALVIGSVVGLVVSMAFIYLSAPDLALTQISVEIVTVILMLLALSFLPKSTPIDNSLIKKLGHGALAILGGSALGGIAYAAITRNFTSLSDYYLQQAKPAGGGTNVVNVILVDFRGFDTFGEIIVLGIAGLTIFALLEGGLRGQVGRKLARRKPDQNISPERHPMLMVVATRVMLPLALLVGAYIFLRGHNMPGGGFIAGLVVSIALIMQYMASGFGWAAKRLKVDYHGLVGFGILIAGATGIVSMMFGAPFLTSTFDYFHIPLIGEVELASAIAFDVGVFLTVVGAVMLTLANLSRLSRRAGNLSVNKNPMDEDEPHSRGES